MVSCPGMNDKLREITRLLRILNAALIGGAIFLIIVSVLMVEMSGRSLATTDPTLTKYMLIVLLILAAISIPAGIILFRKQMSVAEGKGMIEVLDIYRSALIVRAALAEGVVFFGTIVYLMQRSYSALLIAFLVLGYMLVIFPWRKRMARETGIEEMNG